MPALLPFLSVSPVHPLQDGSGGETGDGGMTVQNFGSDGLFSQTV